MAVLEPPVRPQPRTSIHSGPFVTEPFFDFRNEDNARRMRRLKVARTIFRKDYTPVRVARKILAMLESPVYARRAASIPARLAQEDGVKTACDALETLQQRNRQQL